MTVPSDADRARHAGQVMGAFLSADGRTPLNAQEAMSNDHSTYRTTQPGSSDDPAISSGDGMDQPGAPPRDRPPTDRLIGIREIRQLFGLGRTAAYDLTHRPGFPAPVPVSRNAYRWWASEVAVFTAALRADSQHPSGSPRRRAQQRMSPKDAAHLRITGKVRAARNRRTPR
jgi:predicted DNA-binding transcriptional regulator AlpA